MNQPMPYRKSTAALLAASFALTHGSALADYTATGDVAPVTPLNDSGTDLTVGDTGVGTFELDDNVTFASKDVFVGKQAGGDGTLLLHSSSYVFSVPANPANINWNLSGSMYLGGDASTAGGVGAIEIGNGVDLNIDGTLKIYSGSEFRNHPSYGFVVGSNVSVDQLDLSAGGTYNLDGGSLTIRNAVAPDLTSGFNWGIGSLTFENAGLDVSAGGTFGDTFEHDNGSSLIIGGLTTVGVNGATEASGTMTSDSIFTTNGLTVENFGTYDLDGGTTSAGAVTIESDGEFNVNGGTLEYDSVTVNAGGAFNFNTGTLNDSGNLSIGTGSFLGDNLTLNGTRKLNVAGTLTVENGATVTNDSTSGTTLTAGELHLDAGSTFVVDGNAKVSVDTLTNDATGVVSLLYGGVTLNVGGFNVGASGAFGENLTLAAGQAVTVNDDVVVDANQTLTLNGGALYMRSGAGVDTTASGASLDFQAGRISYDSDQTLDTSHELSGLSLSTGKTLELVDDADLTVDGQALVINGGRLTVGQLIRTGGTADVTLTSGDLQITEGDASISSTGALGDNVTLGSGAWLGVYDNDGGFVAGDLVIENGASFTLDGGAINVDEVVRNGTGSFTYNSGVLQVFTGGLDVGGTGLISSGTTLNVGDNLYAYSGNTTIKTGASLTLDGGTINTLQLIREGTGSFSFVSGNLRLTQDVTIGAGGLFTTNQTFDSTRQLRLNGSSKLTVLSGMSVNVGNSGTFGGSTDLRVGELDLDGILTLDNNGSLYVAGDLDATGTGSLVLTDGTLSADKLIYDKDLTVGAGVTVYTPYADLGNNKIYNNGFFEAGNELQNVSEVRNTGTFIAVGQLGGPGIPDVFNFSTGDMRLVGGSFLSLDNTGDLKLENLYGGARAVVFGADGMENGSGGRIEIEQAVSGVDSSTLTVITSGGFDQSASDAELVFTIDRPTLPGIVNAMFIIEQDAVLDGTIKVEFTDPEYTPEVGDSFYLIDVRGTLTLEKSVASLFDLPELNPEVAPLLAGAVGEDPLLEWDLSTFAQDGKIHVSEVPEPSSLVILGIGGLMLAARRRR